MTCKRVTKEEKQQRHEWALRKIDQGVGFSELASLVGETWGRSCRSVRRLVSDAHKEWVDVAFGDNKIDQRVPLFQSVARLECTARKVAESSHFAVVVGCIAQLDKMMALGADQKGFRGHPTYYYRR